MFLRVLVLFLIIGCSQEVDLESVLRHNPDLNRFMVGDYNVEYEELDKEKVVDYQNKDDALGSWYREVEAKEYLLATIKKEGNEFIALVDDDKVVQILAFISLELG